MAARKNRGTKESPWSEQHRERIRASMLIKRLEDHVLSDKDMKPTQVAAALGLLKKIVPDLSSVEQTTTITERNVVRVPEPALTVEDWKDSVERRRH